MMLQRMEAHAAYIPRAGLDALTNYKYKSGEYSWLDLRLNAFWFWCAEQLPRSMAPNLVTLVGTCHLFVIALLAEIFDPELRGESPTWVYVVNAWCLFVYQTMDAVDGKQARRTNSSSPLGQLFDHGCDALGTTFIAIGLCSLMGFGSGQRTVAILATVQIPFYLCQWEENHVHVLRAQVGNFGVTEGQYLSMALNLVSAGLGTAFWKQTLAQLVAPLGLPILPAALADTDLGMVAVLVGGFFPAVLASSSVLSVARSGANFARALLLLAPLVLQQGLQLCLQAYSPGREFFAEHPVPLIAMQGTLLAHLINRIIVASVCHLEFPLVHRILYPTPFFIMVLFVLGRREDPVEEAEAALVKLLITLYGVAVIVQYLHFTVCVTLAITRHLGIHCFNLRKRNKE